MDSAGRSTPHRWMRVFLVVGFSVLPVFPAFGGDWITMFQDRALWPARLRALTFPSGHVLDAHRSLQYGSWSVAFGASPPVVERASSVPDDGTGGLWIRGLKCTNPVAGEQQCGFDLMTRGTLRNIRNAGCFLVPWKKNPGDPPSRVPSLKIGCPSDLQIE